MRTIRKFTMSVIVPSKAASHLTRQIQVCRQEPEQTLIGCCAFNSYLDAFFAFAGHIQTAPTSRPKMRLQKLHYWHNAYVERL